MALFEQEPEKKEENLLPKVIIAIDLNQPTTEMANYSLWEKLLGIAYVLLKFKEQRSLRKKFILARWTNTEEWHTLEKYFDPSRTTVELLFQSEKANTIDQTLKEDDEAERVGNVVLKSVETILYQKYVDPLKENRKYEWHHTYPSLGHYFLQLMKFRGFNTSYLGYLNAFDSTAFQEAFNEIIKASNLHEEEYDGESLAGSQFSSIPTFSGEAGKEIVHRELNQSLRSNLKLEISASGGEDRLEFSSATTML
jgi:hypothetical protein